MGLQMERWLPDSDLSLRSEHHERTGRGGSRRKVRHLGHKLMTHQQRYIPFPHYAIREAYPPADVDGIRRKLLDVPYAHRSPAQRLDVYLPEAGEGPFPVIVSIHGGAFLAWDKSDSQVMPMLQGLGRGYAVVAVNYRLSWEAKFPAQLHDIKSAVRWVRANAREFPFDPARIAAWGGSAGGYLSAMLGVSAGIAELEDLSQGNPDRPSDVQAVVAWYPPTDFLTMDVQLMQAGMPPEAGKEHSGPNSPESLLLGAQVTTVPERVRAASPATYVTAATPPFFLQHGTKDATVPAQQSIELAETLRRALGDDKVRLELVDDAVHLDPKFLTVENIDRVLTFLDRCFQRT